MKQIELEQEELCHKFEVAYQPFNFKLRLGISENLFSGVMPLNGLRHPQEDDMCGWYLWAGEELSNARDFFKPLHVFHLLDYSPILLKYLALPAGWRFLLAGEYEDVWFDVKLLDI